MQGQLETEVKIRISDTAPAIDRIRQLGFEPFAERQFESNTIYDTVTNDLRSAKYLLRLRQSGSASVITFKGPPQSGPHKSREELEISVGSVAVMQQIFERLGYMPKFHYEKYRTEFKRGDEGGVVTVDETPIGSFLELEGPGEWIDGTAAALGFSSRDYLLDSYGKLYLADCQRRGVQPAHMVFSS